MEALLGGEPFQAWGASHLWPLALLVAGILLLLLTRHAAVWQKKTSRRGLAVLVLGFEIGAHALGLLPQTFDVNHSLPFHLCDLAGFAAFVALWFDSRVAASLLYYWGLTLSPQAVLTPAVGFDFPHVSYFLFWSTHLLIIWAAVYVTWLTGFRPDWRGLRFTLLATLGWAALMLVFNALVGSNYLFVNAKPPVASVLDLLGPWPWYLVAEFAAISLVWWLMTVIWRPGKQPHAASGHGR